MTELHAEAYGYLRAAAERAVHDLAREKYDDAYDALDSALDQAERITEGRL